MTTDLVKISEATGIDRVRVELIKDTIARGASDDELTLFLLLAQRTGLDPFSRQIYLIERRAQIDGKWITTRQPQTGIDGLRLLADRTDRYAPGHEPTFSHDENGRLVSATAYVKKWVRGEWHECAATAFYDEYVVTKSDGSPNAFWRDKAHVMLSKCAEALALRRAFPAEMSGLYTADEMGTDDMLPTTQQRIVAASPTDRDQAIELLRQARDRARALGVLQDADIPGKRTIEAMSTEAIRDLAEAWRDETATYLVASTVTHEDVPA